MKNNTPLLSKKKYSFAIQDYSHPYSPHTAARRATLIFSGVTRTIAHGIRSQTKQLLTSSILFSLLVSLTTIYKHTNRFFDALACYQCMESLLNPSPLSVHPQSQASLILASHTLLVHPFLPPYIHPSAALNPHMPVAKARELSSTRVFIYRERWEEKPNNEEEEWGKCGALSLYGLRNKI